MDENRYPECAKMLAVQDKADVLSEFLDWLESADLTICTYWGEYVSTRRTKGQLLADFFGIDLNKVESEKLVMLADIRKDMDK